MDRRFLPKNRSSFLRAGRLVCSHTDTIKEGQGDVMAFKENFQNALNDGDSRHRKLFATFIGFGTLWQVLERVWQNALPDFDRENKRDGHPGVVVSDCVGEGFIPTVAMLVGTSRRGCGFAVLVEDVFKREPGRKTWFGSIPPLQIPYKTFTEKERYVDADKITWNRHCVSGLPKARATAGEITSLRRLMSDFPWALTEDGK